MGRSGYSDDIEDMRKLICWRGAVTKAFKGGRGQAFLRDMLVALDSVADGKLISNDLVRPDGSVCALGAVGKARGIDMSNIDPEDLESVAAKFGIARAMAAEITYENDEGGPSYWSDEKPEARFERMRKWIESQIRKTDDPEVVPQLQSPS